MSALNTAQGFTSSGTDLADIVEQRIQRRAKARQLLHKLGLLQLTEGVVAFIFGVVALIYAAPNGTFTYFLGAPIWSGIFFVISGILAIQASQCRDLPGYVVTQTEKCYIYGHYALTITSLTPAILIVVYSGISVAWCIGTPPEDYPDACKIHHDENAGMAVTNIIIGIILSISCIPFTVFFCCYGRAFGLRVNNMTQTDPVMEDRIQEQSVIIRQQQEEIKRLAQRQEAMEQRFTVPGEAPPPYDEPAPGYGTKSSV